MTVEAGSPTVGIIGAGRLGTVLAGRATASGHRTLVAGSGGPETLRAHLRVRVPGADAVTREEAASADVVFLALPLGQLDTLPREQLRGRVVVDAMNHWWETDGIRPDLTDPHTSTSEIVQSRLPGARLVKAFNHMAYRDIDELWAPGGDPARNAIAIAGDDADAVALVAHLTDAFGFDPLPIGSLAQGVRLEPDTVAFGVTDSSAGLRRAIEMFPQTPRGRAVLAVRELPDLPSVVSG